MSFSLDQLSATLTPYHLSFLRILQHQLKRLLYRFHLFHQILKRSLLLHLLDFLHDLNPQIDRVRLQSSDLERFTVEELDDLCGILRDWVAICDEVANFSWREQI